MVQARTITDFSVVIDETILLSTLEDVQAMYRTNYTGTFNSFNEFYVTNDIDLHQDTFDSSLDRIYSFNGTFSGGGFKLSNHQGYFLCYAGGVIKDVIFLDFHGCAIFSSGWDGENLVFMSGSLDGNQTVPVMGDQFEYGSNVVNNIKVFLHGDAVFVNTAVLMGRTKGASELFLATTSEVSIGLNSNSGVVSSYGACGFNVGCNVHGTCTMNGSTSILMRDRSETDIDGGGYYVSGNLDIVKSSYSHTVSQTLGASNYRARADEGGVYSAIRGSVTISGQDDLLTTSYLGTGSVYQTAFKDFVQGVSEDQYGGSGGVYDVNIDLWVTPWVLADHLDHPAILRAMPHYMAIEDGSTIPSVLGDVTVATATYPVFLEIAYTDNGDSTDSFTYRVLDTTHTEVVEGVVIILAYPFETRSETSVIFDGEVIDADDTANPVNYFLGDPFFVLKQSPIAFESNWIAVDSAEFYRLSYEYDNSGEIILATDLTDTKFFLQNLTPSTLYTLKLYVQAVGSTEYVLTYTTTASTNDNVAENYATFVNEVQDESTGIFDLTDIDEDKFELIENILEDVFENGSRITLNIEIEGVSDDVVTTFVHNGSSVIVDDGTDAILTSFNDDDTDQYIEIETTDGNERIDYDPSTKTLEVDGVTYQIGDSVNIGGKRIQFFES